MSSWHASSLNTAVGSSQPTSPQLSKLNWRNPTVLLSQASSAAGAGARRFYQQLPTWGRGSALHAHGSDSIEMDEEQVSVLGHAPATPPPSAWQLVVALAAISVVICYADRSNISTAIITMSDEYGWAQSQQGVILSMFFLGYLCTQLLGGALADRYGGKGVLTAGVAAWSLCTCLTPPAAAMGVPALIAMRISMGLGEGVAFPAIHSIISRSVPGEHQSTAVGVVTAASYAGTALAFGLSPLLIDRLGWEWVFYLFGAAAIVWLPFWLPQRIAGGSGGGGGGKGFNILSLFSSSAATPAVPPSASAESLGEDSRPPPPQRVLSNAGSIVSEAETEWSDGVAVAYRAQQLRQGVGFAALIRQPEVWAICGAQYTGSWGFYGLLNWLPSFFKDHYHVEVAELGGLTLLPFLVQGGVGAASGLLADRLLQRGWPVKRVRRVLQTVGMLGPAACMLVAASPLTDGDAAAASAWVTLGLGLNALTLAGVSVSHLDIAPKNAGVVFAAGNTCATLAGLLAVPLTGVVLEATDSWPLVFGITAAHYVVGAALFAWWVGDRPLPQDG